MSKSPFDDLWPERTAAYKALRKWAQVHRQRDEVIRQAVAAGIDQRSIQEITGVARTTIARIVAATRTTEAVAASAERMAAAAGATGTAAQVHESLARSARMHESIGKAAATVAGGLPVSRPPAA